MKKYYPLFFLLGMILISLACGATPTPTPVSAADVALTMLSDQVNAKATQAKFDSIAAITAQVVAATATQQAAYVQATQSEQARRDAQATQQRIDDDAATEQARKDAISTEDQRRVDAQSTQQASGTSTAYVITQTAIPPMLTLTQIANVQDIHLRDNGIVVSDLKVKQQRDTNVLQWLIPTLVVILAAFVGARFVNDWSQIREVKNAEGGADIIVYKNRRIIQTRLFPKPVLELESGLMPDVTNAQEQSEIVKRDQGIKALAVMPERTTDQAAQTFNKYFGSQQNDLPFDVVDADEVPPTGLLDDPTLQTLQKDWKEAKGDQ
jgi:hypothetical protein